MNEVKSLKPWNISAQSKIVFPHLLKPLEVAKFSKGDSSKTSTSA